MDFAFVPLTAWPGKKTEDYRRKRSNFSAGYTATIDLLTRELTYLKAKEVVIQLDVDRSQIRRDGLPRSDARPRGPGVILSFDSPKGAMSFPCDQFTAWEDNLRAIALALEALRKVDRYGVTRNAEQYRGWAALPDNSREVTGFPNVETAFAWLKLKLNWANPVWNLPWSEFQKREIRRAGIALFHPDRNAGNDKDWKLWHAAAILLGIEI